MAPCSVRHIPAPGEPLGWGSFSSQWDFGAHCPRHFSAPNPCSCPLVDVQLFNQWFSGAGTGQGKRYREVARTLCSGPSLGHPTQSPSPGVSPSVHAEGAEVCRDSRAPSEAPSASPADCINKYGSPYVKSPDFVACAQSKSVSHVSLQVR